MNAGSVDSLELVSAEVKNHLASWFGTSARLSSSPPVVRKFKRSYIVRYTVEDDIQTTGVLVKIPRPGSANTLQEAMELQKPRPATQREFDILVACSRIFSRADSRNLCAVRPLSYWPEWNAIAMEELKSRSLGAIHLRMPLQSSWAPAEKKFETLLYRAGRWLRVFHQEMGNPGAEEIPKPSLLAEFDNRVAMVREYVGQVPGLAAIRDAFEKQADKLHDISLPVATLHGDFKAGNILVCEDGRLAAVDTKMRYRGPVYMDIAKLLSDLQTDHYAALSLGLFARPLAWEKAFLGGYFGSELCNADALRIYRMLAVLEKWAWDEKLLASKGLSYRPLRILARRHFSRLLSRMTK